MKNELQEFPKTGSTLYTPILSKYFKSPAGIRKPKNTMVFDNIVSWDEDYYWLEQSCSYAYTEIEIRTLLQQIDVISFLDVLYITCREGIPKNGKCYTIDSDDYICEHLFENWVEINRIRRGIVRDLVPDMTMLKMIVIRVLKEMNTELQKRHVEQCETVLKPSQTKLLLIL